MDSIYKILESLDQVNENKDKMKDDAKIMDLDEFVEKYTGEGMSKAEAISHYKDMNEAVEEAEITPIDHSDDEDGASSDDIASAITRRLMAHPKFGALVREIDIIDLNDAIEDIAQFHKGGDLGTSDVSNMVNDVLKQLGKPDALKEEDLEEMIGYYTIMKDGKVVARGVRATSEQDAIKQAYMKMGSASKYTGAGMDSFKAVREEQEVNEEDVEENAFNQAAAAAARAGKEEFEFGGKTHPVKMDKDTAEKLDDDINEDEDSMPASPDEGGMAGDQIEFIKYAADEIKDHIDAGGDFPEWFQNKMSDVYGKMKDLHGYMEGDKRNDADNESDEEQLDEKAVSKDQQEAAGAALSAKRGDIPVSELVGASKEMYDSMTEKELEDFAGTKHKGLPEKVKKKKTESTVAGAVAVGADAAGSNIYGNPSVYENFNSKVENMITESMNVSVNSSNDPHAEPSITVSATGEDANMLAQLLQLAAVPKQPCESCGRMHEGSCMNEDEEANSANNTHTYDMQYLLNAISGGLNGPKRQINPNNPGDNPMAMSADKVVNIDESEDVSASHLETLYREFKAK